MSDHAEKTAPVQEQLPITITVNIDSIHTSGSLLANASINLNGCFAIRGFKVVQGEHGPFVSMPSYKSGGEYQDVCFPTTKEFRDQIHTAVLDAYQQGLAKAIERGEVQESPCPQ